MSSTHERWDAYKRDVLSGLAAVKFAPVYAGLKSAKPSGDGWMLACCPLHEDGRPSLGYNTATGLWSCFSGCGKGDAFEFVTRTTGRPFKDVLLDLGDGLGLERPAGGPSDVEPVTYPYLDEAGRLLYEVIRGPNKKFWQRRPDGQGGWIKDLKNVRRVLYRLPDVLNRPDETVYIVEGEKDADALHAAGVLATTNSGGAGKWQASHSEHLRGRHVVILPDNDEPGRDHGVKVAAALAGVAASVKIVSLPDLPPKGDVSDWLAAGGDRGQLEIFVGKAVECGPAPRVPVVDERALPAIETHDRPLREIFDAAWAAILDANEPPKVFNTSGCLARLRDYDHGPQIELLTDRSAMSLLARVADWFKTTSKNSVHTKPPKEAAADLVVNPHPSLPRLDSVIATPVFDHDWRLITQPGYHQDSRLWFHVESGAATYDVPDRPTDTEVKAALSLILDDLLVDFPFTAASDKAHALAALLLPFVRRMFEGPTPIHLIEASTPGSGKSLLAELITIIALGHSMGCTTLTTNEDDTRKKLTAILSRGPAVIVIDNLKDGLWSAQVAAAITAEVWEDRVLGQTRIVTFPNRALWLMSANNPRLSGEIARRCIRIRIDSGEEQPWTRTGFKHYPIKEWTTQNRVRLVRAVLTLIQHWIVCGAPLLSGAAPKGSFETWSRIVGGMVQHCGLGGFLGDMDEFYEAADPEAGEWRAFVQAWWDAHHDTPVSAKDLLQLAMNKDLVTFAYAAHSDQAQRARFGRALSSLRDRRFGDHRVVVASDSHKKVGVFRLVMLNKELFT